MSEGEREREGLRVITYSANPPFFLWRPGCRCRWLAGGREGGSSGLRKQGKEGREGGVAMAERGVKTRRRMWLRGGGCCGGR